MNFEGARSPCALHRNCIEIGPCRAPGMHRFSKGISPEIRCTWHFSRRRREKCQVHLPRPQGGTAARATCRDSALVKKRRLLGAPQIAMNSHGILCHLHIPRGRSKDFTSAPEILAKLSEFSPAIFHHVNLDRGCPDSRGGQSRARILKTLQEFQAQR